MAVDSRSSPEEPSSRALSRVLAAGRLGAWIAVALALVALVVVRTYAPASHESLPVLWQLPDWHLVDQNGQPFGARDLRGRVYIANFIFTSCVLECPRLTRQMAHLQPGIAALGDRARLVSISVNPTDDTPARLREYMARYHADARIWSFVTGPTEAVMRAVSDGFRVGVEQPPRGPNGEFNPIALAHSNRFALVDGSGRLRGSYEADDDGMRRLLADTSALVHER